MIIYKVGLIVGVNTAMPEYLDGFVESILDESDMGSSFNFSLSTANALGGKVSLNSKIIGFNTSCSPASSSFALSYDFLSLNKQDYILSLNTYTMTEEMLDIINKHNLLNYINNINKRGISEGSSAILLSKKKDRAICKVLYLQSIKDINIFSPKIDESLLKVAIEEFLIKYDLTKISLILATGLFSAYLEKLFYDIKNTYFKKTEMVLLDKIIGFNPSMNFSMSICLAIKLCKDNLIIKNLNDKVIVDNNINPENILILP
jgi:hypothetical protein